MRASERTFFDAPDGFMTVRHVTLHGTNFEIGRWLGELAIHAFDTLAGTLDGINSAGLTVSILADNEAVNELGPKLEPHPGPLQVVGLHELAVMRLPLDTCATVAEAEAKEALLTVKQHYRFIPCHYFVADRSGESFIYENSTCRNIQYLFDGGHFLIRGHT